MVRLSPTMAHFPAFAASLGPGGRPLPRKLVSLVVLLEALKWEGFEERAGWFTRVLSMNATHILPFYIADCICDDVGRYRCVNSNPSPQVVLMKVKLLIFVSFFGLAPQ